MHLRRLRLYAFEGESGHQEDQEKDKIAADERGGARIKLQSVFDSCLFALIRGHFFLICDHLRKSTAMSLRAFLNTSRNIFSVSLPVRVFCSDGW
jgi:hypothetical protein